VVTPSLLLTSELDALLRVLCDRDVAKPMPVDVFRAELDTDIVGVE